LHDRAHDGTYSRVAGVCLVHPTSPADPVFQTDGYNHRGAVVVVDPAQLVVRVGPKQVTVGVESLLQSWLILAPVCPFIRVESELAPEAGTSGVTVVQYFEISDSAVINRFEKCRK
jgi:hypothetical protein